MNRYHTAADEIGHVFDAAAESFDEHIDDFEVEDCDDEFDGPEFE